MFRQAVALAIAMLGVPPAHAVPDSVNWVLYELRALDRVGGLDFDFTGRYRLGPDQPIMLMSAIGHRGEFAWSRLLERDRFPSTAFPSYADVTVTGPLTYDQRVVGYPGQPSGGGMWGILGSYRATVAAGESILLAFAVPGGEFTERPELRRAR